MVRGTEIEIKFVASSAMLNGLRGHASLTGPERIQTLRSTYFDTIGSRLKQGGASLRIREIGDGEREQTLKLAPSSSSTVRRREWTVSAAKEEPEPERFPRTARTALVRLLGNAALQPLATNEIERTSRLVRFGATEIEVAFDAGSIRAGQRQRDIRELELELVKGRLADVIDFALTLPLGSELRWSVLSKAEQSHNLAFDLARKASHASHPQLQPGMNAAAAFRAIAWSCLGHLLANYEIVLTDGDIEAVHQSRIAVRRMRAAFSLFREITADKTSPLLRAELKAVAKCLGQVRDLDVLIDRVRKASPSDASPTPLVAHLAMRRQAELGTAQTMLAAAPFQQLLLQIAVWLENGEWRKLRRNSEARLPIRDYAANILAQRRRKLRKKSAHLEKLSDTKLHRIRKDTKTLRYAAEFVAELHGGKPSDPPRRAFAKTLAKAQDTLGGIQDAATARSLHRELFDDLDPVTAAKFAEQLELILQGARKDRKKALRSARRALQAAWDGPKWWKPEETPGLVLPDSDFPAAPD